MKNSINKKIVLVISIVFIIIAILIISVVINMSKKNWKNKFEVSYVDHINNEKEDYYEYKIKNKTNDNINEVAAIFEVTALLDKKSFNIEYYVGDLSLGEEKIIKLDWDTIVDYANYYNIEVKFLDVELNEIKYNYNYDFDFDDKIVEENEEERAKIVRNINLELGNKVETTLNDLEKYIDYYNGKDIMKAYVLEGKIIDINENLNHITNQKYQEITLSDKSGLNNVKIAMIDDNELNEKDYLNSNVKIKTFCEMYSEFTVCTGGKIVDDDNVLYNDKDIFSLTVDQYLKYNEKFLNTYFVFDGYVILNTGEDTKNYVGTVRYASGLGKEFNIKSFEQDNGDSIVYNGKLQCQLADNKSFEFKNCTILE